VYVELILGGAREHRLVDSEELLEAFRSDPGYPHYTHVPTTPTDTLVPEDLAVSLALNSNAKGVTFVSMMRRSAEANLALLPTNALAETTREEREHLANFLAAICRWPAFGASMATKVLHKKRRALIPVLDNAAIFGTYMNPDWPDSPATKSKAYVESVKDAASIREALDAIVRDLARPQNRPAWVELARLQSDRTLIEIFDMVWWVYFRRHEPVAPRRQGKAA
jgi:hypothetical protein